MATKKQTLDDSLGRKHKIFRTKVLKKSQKELAEDLGKTQQLISKLESGQEISAEDKPYYTRNGMNWNWYYADEDSMLRGEQGVEEAGVSYKNMSSLIIPPSDHALNNALNHFMMMMREQLKNYEYIIKAVHFSNAERIDLYGRMLDRILKETKLLKQNF